jgi:FdhD protein
MGGESMDVLTQGITPQKRFHFDGIRWRAEMSEVVRELPVTLFVNGREWVTAAVTPCDLKDWALGFLAGEGILDSADRVTVFQWREDEGQVWLRVPGLQWPDSVGTESRYLGSCCGQSRPGFFNPDGVEPLIRDTRFEPDNLQHAFRALSAWSHSQHSGGLHAAGAARGSDLILARADVGRHNALDKVFGALLSSGSPVPQDAYIVFSGRLSAEIVWKVRKMQMAAIVSNAAPTSLGIELAQKLGITLIGFLRDNEMSVFANAERLGLEPLV